jgi:hypothetical protein
MAERLVQALLLHLQRRHGSQLGRPPWLRDLIGPENVGKEIPCRICGGRHVIERPYADSTTADRTHLYVTCRGQRYFIGQVADPEPASS